MSSEILLMFQETTRMFLYLGGQLVVLFLVLSYVVGIIQHFLPPEKVQKILGNQRGLIIAALLGAVTPFCSATTIPFLKGLLRAKANFGSIMVFLFASPLLNPMILGLLSFSFGIGIAVLYASVALTVSIIAGYVLEKMGCEDQVKASVFVGHNETVSCAGVNIRSKPSCAGACSAQKQPSDSLWIKTAKNTWADFVSALPYLTLGVAVGSVVYGFVPTDFISAVAGGENVFAVPVAAVIGIPLYISAEALIPLSSVLIGKGMGMGALMALIIGSAGASLTEVILLKSIFRNQLIAAFLIVVLAMAVTAGYLYNIVF